MPRYFTLEELCHTSTTLPNIPTWQVVDNLKALVNNLLDPIRVAWEKPITVTSGYRSAEVNKAVGGAKTSQHCFGYACDIDVGTPDDNKKLFDFICSKGFTFDQCIDESDYAWIHISYKINGNRQQILHIKNKK